MPAKKKGGKGKGKGKKRGKKVNAKEAEEIASRKRAEFFQLSTQRFLSNVFSANAFSSKYNDVKVNQLTY